MRVSAPRVESHHAPTTRSARERPTTATIPGARPRRSSHTAAAPPATSHRSPASRRSSDVRSGSAGVARRTSSGATPATRKLCRLSPSRGSMRTALSHAQTPYPGCPARWYEVPRLYHPAGSPGARRVYRSNACTARPYSPAWNAVSPWSNTAAGSSGASWATPAAPGVARPVSRTRTPVTGAVPPAPPVLARGAAASTPSNAASSASTSDRRTVGSDGSGAYRAAEIRSSTAPTRLAFSSGTPASLRASAERSRTPRRLLSHAPAKRSASANRSASDGSSVRSWSSRRRRRRWRRSPAGESVPPRRRRRQIRAPANSRSGSAWSAANHDDRTHVRESVSGAVFRNRSVAVGGESAVAAAGVARSLSGATAATSNAPSPGWKNAYRMDGISTSPACRGMSTHANVFDPWMVPPRGSVTASSLGGNASTPRSSGSSGGGRAFTLPVPSTTTVSTAASPTGTVAGSIRPRSVYSPTAPVKPGG